MICRDWDRTYSADGGEASAFSEDVGYNGPLQGPVVSHIMASPGRVKRSLACQPRIGRNLAMTFRKPAAQSARFVATRGRLSSARISESVRRISGMPRASAAAFRRFHHMGDWMG